MRRQYINAREAPPAAPCRRSPGATRRHGAGAHAPPARASGAGFARAIRSGFGYLSFLPPGGRLNNRMPRAIKIVIACVLLVLLFIGVDREMIATQVAALDWRPAAIGLAAVALELFANAWKWRCSLRLHDLSFPWPYLFRTGCFAYFFNNLLPSAIGGDVYRIYRTMTPDVERSRAISAVIVERVVGLGAMLFLGTLGAFLLAGTSALARWYLALVALGVLGVAAIIAALALGWLDRPRALLARIHWLEPVRGNLQRILRARAGWGGLVAASFAFQILAVAVIYVSFDAAGARIPMAAAAVITAAAGIASVLPISISGLGVVEGSIAGTAVAVGVDYHTALIAAVVVRMLSWAIAAGCGLLYLVDPDAGARPRSSEAVR
jgi:uncharacterized protein (TIRG00374 family)